MTGIGSGVSDLVANTFSSYFFVKFGIRKSLSVANGASTVGGFVILFYALNHQTSWTFPVLVMLTKFGVSCAFNVLYVSHGTLWPVLFTATAMGICNSVAKLFAGMSPIFAEMQEPLPMIVFTVLTGITCILALFIQIDTKKSNIK